MNDPKTAPIPSELIAKLIDATAIVNACNAEISRIILDHVGLIQGDIIEDKMTGNQYKVASASGYLRNSQYGGITVTAYRYYKSGKRAGRTAYSTSYLHGIDGYTKITVDAPK